jgi:O-antigen ligase
LSTGAAADPRTLTAARWLRAVSGLASVRPSAYVPLGIACIGIGFLLLLRALTVRILRGTLGAQRFSFQGFNHPITLAAGPSRGGRGWSFDLAQTAFPRAPLLVPGLVFLGWVVFQIVPMPATIIPLLRSGEVGPGWQPLTLSLPDTLRGLGFVAGALVLHMAAAAVFASGEPRERFRRMLAVLGLVLAFVALIQVASGSPLIYGMFRPLDQPELVSYGPFVNRNSFAGYMLMVIPMCLALLAHSFQRYARRVGGRTNLRNRVVSLATPEGTSFLYATVPVLATIGALIATMSRGALLAFAISLALAALSRRKGEIPAWLLAIGFATMALSWFGLERLEARFVTVSDDAPGRTLVWKDALGRMGGRWLTGWGFNTFGSAMSHVKLWRLPAGASPLRPPVAAAVANGQRFGTRAPAEIAGFSWYREAHNEYVQVLVETGIPGLLIAVWCIVAMLSAARHDQWLVAALVAILLHSFVDFDLQIPAAAVLFVVLAGMRPPSSCPQ